MSDYIKRSDALNFDLEIECEPEDLQPMMEGMVRVMDYIKQLPAADVAPVVHGKWIKDRLISTGGGTYGVYRCSVCENGYQDVGYGFDYCPDCGAKMKG